MDWGDNFFSGIFSALFGDDDIFSDASNNADAQFGSRKPGNYNKNKTSNNPNNSFGDDIPEGKYTRDTSSNSNNSRPNVNRTTNRTTSTSNVNSRFARNTSTSNQSYSNRNKQKSDQEYYDVDWDPYAKYPKNNKTSSSSYNSSSQNNNSAWDNSNNTFYNSFEDNNQYSQNFNRDKSATASQSFRRQHGERNKVGGYPTLSKKGFRTVCNDKASFTFGDPHFSTYDHGIRGVAFPYSLQVENPKNRKIVVSGKFCNSTGAWIKSLMPDMADRFGDLVINESVNCVDSTFNVDSYLFMPYGVLALKKTQKIYLNVDVFVDGPGPQHLLRYVYGFDYYIYDDDPREFQTKTGGNLNTNQEGFDELIGLIAHVIKSDGITAPEEIRVVIDFFKKFNEVDKEYLKNRLKFKLANLSNIESDCQTIKKSFNTQTKLTFLALFFRIAISDVLVPHKELDLIEKISNLMGIPQSDYNSLKAEFLPASDKIWHIFGLTSKATKEQLKNAYKAKCKECHPDRFANASKEEYKRAEERFKELQDMYTFLLRKF